MNTLLYDCESLNVMWVRREYMIFEVHIWYMYDYIVCESILIILCTNYYLNVLSPHFCVVAYVLLWSVDNQVPK